MLAAQRGDHQAFDTLADTHRPRLLAAIRTIAGARQDAEDVVQVVLLQAWRDIGQLRQPERFPAWLHQIARHRARDFLRRAHPATVQWEQADGRVAGVPPGDLAAELHDAMTRLPALYRVAAELFYVAGLSVGETARALAVPAGTVKRRLHEARRHLRDVLADPPHRDAEGGSRVLDLEDLGSLVLPTMGWERLALSPDGRWVAYVVRPANGAGEEIRVHDLESGRVQAITPGWGTSNVPRWSPDGAALAFVSTRGGEPRLWVWDRQTGESRLAADVPVVRHMWFEAPCWLPDGHSLLVKVRARGWRPVHEQSSAAPDAPAREVWASPPEAQRAAPGPSWKDRYRGDVAVVDIASGALQRLTDAGHPLGVAVAPDGTHVAAMFARSARPDSPAVVFDLHVLPVDGGAGRVLAEDVSQSYGTEFAWSADGSRIAYTTFGDGEGRLVIASLDGPRRVVGGRDLGNEEGVPPLWSRDGDTVYCWADMALHAVDAGTGEVARLPVPDGHSVYGAIQGIGGAIAPDFGTPGTVVALTRNRDTRQTGLWRLGVGVAEPVVPAADRNLLEGVLLGGDVRGNRLVGFVEDLRHPGELHVFDAAEPVFRERRVSRLNPTVPEVPSSARLMSWTDGASRRHLAAVLLPDGPGPWPTVFHVYAGEGQASRMHDYACGLGAWNPLLLVARGYAVVLPDMDTGAPEPCDAIADQAVCCLDAAIANGYAEAGRAAIVGHSHGGYSALAVITRTDRFQAAIVSAAVSDLASFACTIAGNELVWSGRTERGLFGLGASPWEAPERFIRNSPLYGVDRVRTPVLLFHGTEDPVPIAQSEAFYAGLLRLRKPAVLVRYRGEGHGIGGWSHDTLADYWRRSLDWLARHLRN